MVVLQLNSMVMLEALIQVYNDNGIIIIINVSFVSDFWGIWLYYNVTCRTGDQGVKNNAGD